METNATCAESFHIRVTGTGKCVSARIRITSFLIVGHSQWRRNCAYSRQDARCRFDRFHFLIIAACRALQAGNTLRQFDPARAQLSSQGVSTVYASVK
jgi:hypothetical protein